MGDTYNLVSLCQSTSLFRVANTLISSTNLTHGSLILGELQTVVPPGRTNHYAILQKWVKKKEWNSKSESKEDNVWKRDSNVQASSKEQLRAERADCEQL